MKKWLIVIAVAVVAILVVVVSMVSFEGNEEKGKKMTVILDWYPNAVHSFLYDALDKGYFTDAGLDVEFKPPADTNDPLKLVATGKVKFAISYQNQVVTARSENLPIVSVAAVVREPLTQLMTAENSGIKRPRDLEGRKVGYSSIELYRTFVEAMVREDGGDPAKVQFIDIGWDLIPAMLNKKVDAIMGGFINHEKPIFASKGMNIRVIEGKQYGVPDYYELVLIANEDTVANDRQTVDAFVGVMRKGFAEMKKDPQKSLNLLLSKQMEQFPLKADIEKESLDILLPRMDAGDNAYGSQTLESWQSAADWMFANGAIQQKVDAKKAFINIEP